MNRHKNIHSRYVYGSAATATATSAAAADAAAPLPTDVPRSTLPPLVRNGSRVSIKRNRKKLRTNYPVAQALTSVQERSGVGGKRKPKPEKKLTEKGTRIASNVVLTAMGSGRFYFYEMEMDIVLYLALVM